MIKICPAKENKSNIIVKKVGGILKSIIIYDDIIIIKIPMISKCIYFIILNLANKKPL